MDVISIALKKRQDVERYEIHEVVTNPAVLSRVQPNETLLKAVLRSIKSYAEAHDDEWVPFTVDEALAAIEPGAGGQRLVAWRQQRADGDVGFGVGMQLGGGHGHAGQVRIGDPETDLVATFNAGLV